MYLILNKDKTFKIVSDWKAHKSEKEFAVIGGTKSDKGKLVAEKKGNKNEKAKAK